jgi:putative oxidoreductase
MSPLSKLNDLLAAIGRFLQAPVLLVIRLFWGWHLMLTGWGKFHHLDRVAGYFGSLGIPAPKFSAILGASTECTCGLLLALGLLARFASVPLIILLCVAYATAEKASLQVIFSDPDKFLGADPFLFLYAAVIVFAFGPGCLSLDALIFKKKQP